MTSGDRVVTFRVPDRLLAGMETLKERYGTPYSEQIRRALEAWLVNQDAITKAAPRRAGTRRKA